MQTRPKTPCSGTPPPRHAPKRRVLARRHVATLQDTMVWHAATSPCPKTPCSDNPPRRRPPKHRAPPRPAACPLQNTVFRDPSHPARQRLAQSRHYPRDGHRLARSRPPFAIHAHKELPLPERHPRQRHAQRLVSGKILDGNAQVSFHKRMTKAEDKKVTNTRGPARARAYPAA